MQSNEKFDELFKDYIAVCKYSKDIKVTPNNMLKQYLSNTVTSFDAVGDVEEFIQNELDK